ncbi:MAG: alfa-L-rhamnosidase [Lachnospiraceae bacterium]|nr:alfa-L-rhamnosidase [Lachnospiraceae bacterium]
MIWHAAWICPADTMGDICPEFFRSFSEKKAIKKAVLRITALGVYEAVLNQKRVGDFILAPGWTSYKKRLQYQEYDITSFLSEQNELVVTVGKGWYRSPMPGWGASPEWKTIQQAPAGLLAEIEFLYEDGTSSFLGTDLTWGCRESAVRFSEIYDGETYDASLPIASSATESSTPAFSATPFSAASSSTHTFASAFSSSNMDKNRSDTLPVMEFDGPSDSLIPQEGEKVTEQETLFPCRIFETPAGETVIDFGQEISGYVELHLTAHNGEEVLLSHGEVLDADGNFYNGNYRGAKAKLHYICKEGFQTYKPKFTFFGFRYVRIDSFPGGPSAVTRDNFTAIVIHSALSRTGNIRCSNPLLNKLFDNIVWGQKGNFIDVPTDCPQRDERLGWTGDAEVFVRSAALNFDVERFFSKWLSDLRADQGTDGRVGHVIPDLLGDGASAAWGDAACICPWEIYLAYGNKEILSASLPSMEKWITYISTHTNDKNLWTGGTHFGDWLGLDAPSGSYKGSTRDDLIATAFYAYSTSLVVKARKVLNMDASYYETLYSDIIHAFRSHFTEYRTQTECVLAAYFNLASDCKAVADQLATMIVSCGNSLQTGFVGTPYLLYVLSRYGHLKLAYSLLLREQYPSWLYSVTKGATTVWEHWDGIKEDGSFWSMDMNSFNHYAYGSVIAWVYNEAAGIQTSEDGPGYETVRIQPKPDTRLDWLSASLMTRHGRMESGWTRQGDQWRYEITTPVDAVIVIADETIQVKKGSYVFFSPLEEC